MQTVDIPTAQVLTYRKQQIMKQILAIAAASAFVIPGSFLLLGPWMNGTKKN